MNPFLQAALTHLAGYLLELAEEKFGKRVTVLEQQVADLLAEKKAFEQTTQDAEQK